MKKRLQVRDLSPAATAAVVRLLGREAEWALEDDQPQASSAPPADVVVTSAGSLDEATVRLAPLQPTQPVVLLASTALPQAGLRQVNAARPLAVLSDKAGPDRLRAAVEAVCAGLNVTEPAGVIDVAPGGGGASSGTRAGPWMPHSLSARETEVFELMAKGLTNADIGRVLGISANTAKFHVAQILAKLDASTRAEAVHIGLRLGLIGM